MTDHGAAGATGAVGDHTGLKPFLLRQFGRLPMSLRHFIVGRTSPAYRVGTIAVITTDDGRVLLARHSYRHGWGLPGGMLGWNEEPLETIHREVEEELGLKVAVGGPDVVEHRRTPRRIEWYFDLRLAEGMTPEDAVANSPEIEEVGWFAVDDLPELEKFGDVTSLVVPQIFARRFPERFGISN